MKTPISILCISDLHFNNEAMEPVRQLGKDLLAYTNNNEKVSQLRWIPDYIVIAGDITNQGNKNYKEPKKHIEDLLDEFKLPSDRVIMVPGNHDKDTSNYDLIAYKKECDLFEKYQLISSQAIVKEFREHFVSKFANYLSFSKSFLSDTTNDEEGDCLYQDPKLLVPEDVIDDKGKLLSCVRYFKEDSLCFFLVNTEWLYIPPKTLMKEKLKIGSLSISNDYYDEIKEYVKVKENCKLCVPLINDAFNWIKKKHPECTVVTVMHRDFKDLDWFENNHTDSSKKDPVRQIEAVSDVILTGHEHSVNIEPPTFVKNDVQHFQIGSTGIYYTGRKEQNRTACVLNINPANACVEMLNAHYDAINNSWEFVENKRLFPLRHKYYQADRIPIKDKEGRIIIKAKSIDEEIINAEIRAHFNITSSDVLLYPIRYKAESIRKELEEIVLENKGKDKSLFVVVYRIISDKNNDRFVDADSIKQFKNDHLKDCLCNKLIIKEIDVIVPVIAFL